MNPLTNMKNVTKLSEQELRNTSQTSWHDQYKDSAWIFVGGLPYDLTEGDIICIFSQYGEVVNINLIRAKDTGKSKGFCFLCYEDQRSTILAVDNLNGIKILTRTIRVDHVQDYKVPKEGKKTDEETKKLYAEGCAPKPLQIVPKIEQPIQDIRETLADQIEGGIKLPQRLPIYTNVKSEKLSDTEGEQQPMKKHKKEKKKKKDKKKSKKKKSKKSDSSSEETESSDSERIKVKVKTEKFDKSTSHNDQRDRNRRDKHRDKDLKHGKNKHDPDDEVSCRDRSFSKRSERSRSRDRYDKPKSYKRDISPNIPKRWRS